MERYTEQGTGHGTTVDAVTLGAAHAALAASLDDAFCVAGGVETDADGRCTGFRYLDANPAYRALAGRAHASGWRAGEAGPETVWSDAVGRVARGGPAERFECQMADGVRWFDVHAFPVAGTGAVGLLCRDISAGKRAQDALRSAQKYRSLFDSIDEAFALIEVIFDGATCVDYRFLEVNQAFERQTRLSGARGRTARELVPDLERDVIERYGEVAVTGDPVRFECYVAGMDGAWFSAYAVRVGGEGSREVAVVFDDITERKRAELAAAAWGARQAFLLELSDALRPLVQPDRVLATASRLLGRHLAVQRVMFAEFSRHGVDVRTDWVDGLAPVHGHFPADAERPAALHARPGARLLVIRDTADPRELSSIDRASYARDGVAALIAASIVFRDQPVGMLVVHSRTPRDWSEDEIAVVQEVAERAWVSVERTHAEAARREGDARLRRMLQIPTVGIVYFDRGGTVVQANDAFLAISGCKRAALDAGQLRFDQLVPPEWHDGDGERERSQPFEQAWVRPDGRRVWILCAAARLDAHTIVEFVIDVTDRREAQELLRESELRYRAFSSLVPVMMWQADGAGQQVTPNQRWLEYTGECAVDTQSGGWLASLHPDDMPLAARAYSEAIAAGQPLELEYRVRGADGRYRWFLVRQLPVRGADGAIQAWYGAAIDIDARRQAEAALQESEGRFRALADAAPALIWQFGPDGRLEYVNQRYAEVTGATPADLLPDGWRAALHPDDLPYFVAAADDALDDRVPFHLRLRVRARDAQWRWFEVHFAPWFAPDRTYRGHVGIGIDITDGVQAEDALREADRRKDEFLAVLAHELRNPLAPISNAVQMLRRADGKRKADRVMEMAGRQVKHITRLVDDLMEVSRITRGKIELARQPVLLTEILAAAVETSRPALDGARHVFTQRVADECFVLDADKVRLTQVFSNLLNNAAKYTDPGGRIELSAWREDGQAVVAVRDSGIGIPPDKLGHVFGMFAQVEEAGARSQGGLGIGLAMVHKLVAMHGGTVEARSDGVGRGSEFVVRLPLAPGGAVPARPPAAQGEARQGAGVRVLVVDDNRDAADSLCILLGSLGMDAQCVYAGDEALRLIPQLRPDAVVLDIGMPGMDGYAVACAIRADAANEGMRLIALTGWGQEGDRERTRESGFHHHLTKPVDLAALQRLLAEDVHAGQPAH